MDKIVQFDECKEYFDYYKDKGLASINFNTMLEKLANGELDIAGFDRFLLPRTRWIAEAPRKRFYRKIQLGGAIVMGGGDEIINKLENTGNLARYLLLTLFDNRKVVIAKDGGTLEEVDLVDR